MANTVRIKRSTGSSAPTTLANAELAFAEGNEIGYIGIGTGGAGGSATTINKAFGKGAFFDKDTTRTANTILSGPTTGSAAAPTFRSLVAADIPTLLHTKISDFDTGVRTNKLNEMASPTASVSLNSQNITDLADPVNTQDAATKGFVEATAQGLDVKDSCVAATTGNITISTALNNGDTLDGVTLSTNDRVLVKDQSTATQNGIYVVGSSPARAADLASGADAAGVFVFIEQGTTNADNGFVCTSNKGSAVTGTNNLTFAQFSGAGQITAADGLQKSGNTMSVDLKSNGGLVIESSEIAVDLAASSITGTLAVGDGGTGATTASNARSNLGLVIGTDVEPHSDQLTELSSMGQTTANSLADLSAAEVQILDGAVVTTAELNILDGDTSATSTTLATADRMVINDSGVMVQVALSDLVTFLENGSVSGFDIDGGTY
tara:strand:- start:3721 stop:5028 length:1308 start_codon:yes stop_codon:yes gene_type:complete